MKATAAQKAIKTAYTRLLAIESRADLARERLTLADYRSACAAFDELKTPGGESLTISAAVAGFYRRAGYIISEAGPNYKIHF